MPKEEEKKKPLSEEEKIILLKEKKHRKLRHKETDSKIFKGIQESRKQIGQNIDGLDSENARMRGTEIFSI